MSFALITPTFAGDFEQFSLLAHTVERHIPEHVPHYIVVPSADYDTFKPLRSQRTRLLKEEDVLPRWTQGLFKLGRYRVTSRSLPIRGWILQQMIKLAAPSYAPEDVYLYVDSDVAFLKPFDPADEFLRDGKVKLFCEIAQDDWPASVVEQCLSWRKISRRLLGITHEQNPRAGYVGNVIPWRRDVVQSLQAYLDQGWGRSWPERIARCKYFSEYMLYGVYVENVLGYEAAGHYPDDTVRALESWEATEQSVDDLTTMRDQKLSPHHLALMVSCKGQTPAERIDQVFGLRSPDSAVEPTH